MIEAGHVTSLYLGGSAPAPHEPPADRIWLSSATPDDHRYIRCTWIDSFHRAQENYKRTFRGWKEVVGGTIDQLMAATSTRIVCAYNDSGRIVGWIVWTPGRFAGAVHYVYVRHDLDGLRYRRRGIMAALLDAAELGPRFAYTFHGEWKTGSRWKSSHLPKPLHEEIVEWLRGRGVTAVYEPIGEWLK